MKIETAIEILIDIPVGGQQIPLDDRLTACNLAIGALKREQRHRQVATSNHIWLLPGETKD